MHFGLTDCSRRMVLVIDLFQGSGDEQKMLESAWNVVTERLGVCRSSWRVAQFCTMAVSGNSSRYGTAQDTVHAFFMYRLFIIVTTALFPWDSHSVSD